MSKFEELEVKYKNVKKVLKEELKEVMDAIFTEFPHIQRISTYGYTPSFNDGDVCSHYSNIIVDGHGGDGEAYVNDKGEVIYEYDSDIKESEHTKDCDRILKMMEGIETALLLPIYETDFAMVWFRQDNGKVKFVKSDYHPGY